jgi:uncharacterized protein (TIGR02145 family)
MNKMLFLVFALPLLVIFHFSNAQGVVTDIDGNEYTTIVIDGVEWMAENLRTTHYANGDEIPVITSLDETHNGGVIWYNNDEDNAMIYGSLYNWYAVNDERGLCPVGWRVPDQNDWQQLALFVDPNIWGNNNTLGNHLKSTRQQDTPLGGEHSTNEHPRWDADGKRFGLDTYGFSALPAGGYFNENGFSHMGTYAYFWSSTFENELFAQARVLLNTHRGMSRSVYKKNRAFSVRCIRGEEITDNYTLSLLVQPENAGVVTGAGQYSSDQQVNISASANEGFVFLHWENEEGQIISQESDYILQMPANHFSLMAVFDEEVDEGIVIESFPWLEDFEDNDLTTQGWTVFNESGPTVVWDITNSQNYTPDGNYSIYHLFGDWNDGLQKGWLISPAIKVPLDGNLELSFWSYNLWPTWYDKNSLLVSTGSANPLDGDFNEIWGADFVNVYWEQTTLDLSDYAGQTIFISFYYEGRDAHEWYLDDVRLQQQP